MCIRDSLRSLYAEMKGIRRRRGNVCGWLGGVGLAVCHNSELEFYATTENGRLHLQSSGILYILNGQEWFAKWEDDTVVPMSKDRTASRGSINRAIC